MRVRKLIVALAAGTGALLTVGAAAFACTNLVGTNFSTPAAPPGATVRLTASSFSTATAGNTIVMHWGAGNDGPILAEAPLDQAGNFDASFTVPNVAPGFYIVTLGEKGGRGDRSRFQVLPVSGATSQAPAPTVLPGAQPEPDTTGVVVLAAGLGAFGFGLFGAGFVAFAREARRRRQVPVTASVRKD